MEALKNYFIPILIISFIIFRFLKFKKIKGKIPILLQQGAVLIDVRTKHEFNQGSNPISINIPLSEINSILQKFNKEDIILICCASGVRSGTAVSILKSKGFKNAHNAGPWTNTLT